MKYIFFLALALAPFQMRAIEYNLLFDNDQVRTSRVKLESNEQVGAHNDPYPRILIPLSGDSITRLEQDGSTTVIELTPNQAIYLEADPVGELHGGLNGETPLDLIMIELKQPN